MAAVSPIRISFTSGIIEAPAGEVAAAAAGGVFPDNELMDSAIREEGGRLQI